MLPRNHPDRIRIAFDDHRLVANAGLLLPSTLAQHLGLPQLVDRRLDLGRAPGRANTGDKMMTLVASALAGGDCIDDADVLRTGGTACALGSTVKAPSTLGTFLRSFRWGHVRQLDRVSRELHIMSHEKVFTRIQGGFNRAIVFVDDFVGSGDQFISTWNRIPSNQYESFRTLATGSQAKFYYCPAFCTQPGLDSIKSNCPEVSVNPGVLIPDNYGALAPDSIVWPSQLRSTAENFLHSASTRAGIPENLWRGYASLGLTIAFEDSVPDATLPIIYWEKNGWHPLMRRTA